MRVAISMKIRVYGPDGEFRKSRQQCRQRVRVTVAVVTPAAGSLLEMGLIRLAEVDRARQLIDRPDYPSKTVLMSVANLLAGCPL